MPLILAPAAPAIIAAAEWTLAACSAVLVGIGVMESTKDKAGEQDKAKSDTQTIATSRTKCEKCPAIGQVMMVWEKTNGRSALAISYQSAIAKTIYNPELSMIESWTCLGVSFDGWQPANCLFLEAKAKYDNFFRNDEPMSWWKSGDDSMKNQGKRQQDVCSSLDGIPNCHWHFLEPVSFAYYSEAFSAYPNIKVFHTFL
ncbi:hypothetical protein Xbed_03061 [Xenorhabdus beddingii]|uniref:Tox-REase-5 domain-containing protein n=1 Tax=Xenorhabdus beddingii TaxID=40578 RepID=A0A1Y2SM79_9GAMM|nr:restriction endonuclease fold toxin 5 domain-containing protein [Xenorhabdus beddingii]OTA18708.1 hypothetical protein Xbed_03061 [Xenorhabdus beddingii]